VSSCSEPLSTQNVGNALYGLQCMSSDVPEVRSLLTSLSAAVSSCSEPLSAQHVSNALYGLQGVRPCEGGAVLWKIIYNNLRVVIDSLDGSEFGDRDARDLLRTLYIINDSACDVGIEVANFDIAEMVESLRRKSSVIGGLVSGSKSEKQVFLRLVKHFGSIPNVVVSGNEYIDGFEADIMIRVYPAGESGDASFALHVINVEVDGPSHAFPTKRRFCALRDRHLQRAHGIVVLRLDQMSSIRRNDSELLIQSIEETLRELTGGGFFSGTQNLSE
jgi:very-short-patch-repair endonuclease